MSGDGFADVTIYTRLAQNSYFTKSKSGAKMHSSAFARTLTTSVVICAAFTGCRSAVSTHVTPDPVNGGWSTKKIRGIPVTVKVPTHLEVRVIERTYLQPGSACKIQTVKIVEEEVREKNQVFLVDSARPAAGILTFGAAMQEDQQFFSTYDAKIEDKTMNTIKDIIPGLPEILKNLKKARVIANDAATPAAAENYSGVAYVDRLVAVKVFEVNSPCLTDEVREFTNTYVNCSPGCPVPVSVLSPGN